MTAIGLRGRPADQTTRLKSLQEPAQIAAVEPEIAPDVGCGEPVAVRQFDRVSILFSDFEGFTRVSARTSPERVIAELNRPEIVKPRG